MKLPKYVAIREVGPREGFQIEAEVYPTAQKVQLIEALAQTGLKEVQVTSFVRPDRVPQMADAELLVQSLRTFPEVQYSATYLNEKGFDRAEASGKLHMDHYLSLDASEKFSLKNTNASIEERLRRLKAWMVRLKERSLTTVSIGVSSAFGCNYEGDIPLSLVLERLQQLRILVEEHHLGVDRIRLMDTMGWANPGQILRTLEAVERDWPGVPVGMHLHDTRGLGIANAFASLTSGVDEFDSSIGGLGGCPFAGAKGAVGNIATEEFVLLCEELGIETGVNLDALVECVELAETIIGRRLPGTVKSGGTLSKYRLGAIRGETG